jgi:L-ascorbate metabolism protein UlaG (beta-lactamase superfamily)
MPSAITLTFLGHSAWQIAHGEHVILVDPFLTGNPKASVAADDVNPTHIVLTHAHDDHFGDTESIARRTNAQVICSFELANYLKAHGVENAVGMGIGGAAMFPFGQVKFTIAHHSSSAPDGSYCGNPAGVLLTIDGRTIYHAGDTALFLDMQLIGERNHIDVALLPIGDFFTMGIDDAVVAVTFLKPKLTIPIHYNTFPPITVDPERFKTELGARGFECVILDPGKSHTI